MPIMQLVLCIRPILYLLVSTGFFPAPIVMGLVINSTCILWQYTCGDRGSCWVYDIVSYRYLYHGILLAIKCISIVFYAFLYLRVKPTKVGDNILLISHNAS